MPKLAMSPNYYNYIIGGMPHGSAMTVPFSQYFSITFCSFGWKLFLLGSQQKENKGWLGYTVTGNTRYIIVKFGKV